VPKVKTTKDIKTLRLPIKWNIPDTIITRFATNIVIQTVENAFKISFFEAKPEIRMASTDGVPTEVRADCVASLIISYEKLPSFINALQKHLENHNASKNKTEDKS
jgi:hypothetical protein